MDGRPAHALTRTRRSVDTGWMPSVGVDAAAVMAVWAGLLFAENTVLGLLWRDQFSGVWEIALARYSVIPLAFVGLAPAAVLVALGWRVAQRAAEGSAPERMALGVLGAMAAGAIAYGVTGGRHFSSMLVRGPFIGLVVTAGAFAGGRAVPWLARTRHRTGALAGLGLVVAVGSWLADGYVLPRLYPAFHAALFVLVWLGGALLAFAARRELLFSARLADAATAAVFIALCLWATRLPRAIADLDRAANLRIVLVEHAPLLGFAVALETRWRPPAADPSAGPDVQTGPGEIARSLNWTGHDLVLLTVDALRADHVSAYGYERPTTPNIDALAGEGAVFDAAYCPTPHTSYSVSSMMTGKYLRPLLALGLGDDSDTWARYLQLYGWRTASFYPPAVFFIDESRFTSFEKEHLGFEYAKVEFAEPAVRAVQVEQYLDAAPPEKPLFLWVHFFEPHEPYVMHAEHPFSGGPSADMDAYDSEVATADDGIGRIVRLVRDRRPGAVFIVTADHGEEFGDHGGRYHGTTVYEEQVRVPLVIVAPGVRAGLRVSSVVQTIDLLPTDLSALGVPRPARLRGRDLGPLMAAAPAANDPGSAGAPGGDLGFALSETDEYALAASGFDRLICQRRAAACALYDLKTDPSERRDRAPQDPRRTAELKELLRATERDHGRYETAGGAVWPDALRRGVQGDVEAALDVAALLDDADVTIRRKAAEVCFSLHDSSTLPAVQRALATDEDGEVKKWAALADVRMGGNASLVDALLRDARPEWRHAAALALGTRGDTRACEAIAAWWNDVVPRSAEERSDGEPDQLSLDLSHTEELLSATVKSRCRDAVAPLLRGLEDVRARPYIADALGALADRRAIDPLRILQAREQNLTNREHETAALRALGASEDLIDPPSLRK